MQFVYLIKPYKILVSIHFFNSLNCNRENGVPAIDTVRLACLVQCCSALVACPLPSPTKVIVLYQSSRVCCVNGKGLLKTIAIWFYLKHMEKKKKTVCVLHNNVSQLNKFQIHMPCKHFKVTFMLLDAIPATTSD